MSNRHLARTIALQTLFEWDFNNRSQRLFDLLEYNKAMFAPGLEDQTFTESVVKGVTKNLEGIDAIIQKFAPEWPIDQITIVDRNILRIGVFELKFNTEMPPRVAINEAIELAKAFGGEHSYKFVNGVLGAIYKEMQTHNEKQDQDKSDHKQIDKKLEPEEVSVGGVVYRNTGENYVFALIKDAIDKWTFPKGKIGDKNKGEDIQTALIRELNEEIGVTNCTVKSPLGNIDVMVRPPNVKAYPKRIFYYLVETTDEQLKPEHTITVKDAQWFSENGAMEALGYENTKSIFQNALNMLKSL